MAAVPETLPVIFPVSPPVAVAVPRAIVPPAKVRVSALWVKVKSAVEGAEFQVITAPLPRNKSDQAIAEVPRASMLSVSETRVVFMATEAKYESAGKALPEAIPVKAPAKVTEVSVSVVAS